MRFKQSLIFIVCLVLVLATPASMLAKSDGRQVYLKYNLRYDPDRNKASCINYQNGIIIPAGTKITILSYNKRWINIMTEDGIKIKMEYRVKYTGLPPAKWIEKVTSPTDPTPEWKKKFTDLEWKGIRGGKALEGMRKEAVIVALGYPPAHKTPSTDLDRWTYWVNRFAIFSIVFADGKVVEVGPQGR